MPILVSAGQARSPKGQQVCIAGPVDGVPLGVPKKCWHQETEGQGGGAMACGGRGVGGGRQADWATISFLVFWGLTVLLPGHRGHTGPGADPARSRGGERSATCHLPPPPPPAPRVLSPQVGTLSCMCQLPDRGIPTPGGRGRVHGPALPRALGCSPGHRGSPAWSGVCAHGRGPASLGSCPDPPCMSVPTPSLGVQARIRPSVHCPR